MSRNSKYEKSGKFAAGFVAFGARLDVSTAIFTATNAVQNNYATSMDRKAAKGKERADDEDDGISDEERALLQEIEENRNLLEEMKKDAQESNSLVKKVLCFLSEVISDVDGDFMTDASAMRLRLYKLRHDTPRVVRDGFQILAHYMDGKSIDTDALDSYMKLVDGWAPHMSGFMAGMVGSKSAFGKRPVLNRGGLKAHKSGKASQYKFQGQTASSSTQSTTTQATRISLDGLGLESSFKSEIFTSRTLWTAPNGTKHTYKVYQRNDIDWHMIRTNGDKNFIGKTNLEASLAGLAPQLKSGYFTTLHHTGQSNKGPLIEASTHIHSFKGIKIHDGTSKPKRAFDILHSQFGFGNKNPDNPVNHSIFAQESIKYWKNRAQEVISEQK